MFKKRRIIMLLIIFLLISLIVGVLIYKKINTSPIPSVTSVGLVDNKIVVEFNIDKTSKKNKIYCIKMKENNYPDAKDTDWILSTNNKCEYEIDDNTYTIYLKNENNTIFEVKETSTLGSVTTLEADKNKVYLALGTTYQPTLSFQKIGFVDDKVKWASSNDSVVNVDSNTGLITALKKGNAKVTASIKDKNITIDVISTDLIIKRPKEFNNSKKYLKCNQYTKEENDLLDEILKDRTNSVGFKTRASVVEVARFITLEFPYKIRYFSENGRLTYASKIDGEGRYYHEGLYLHSSRFKNLARSSEGPQTWGCTMYSRPSKGYRRNGLDCSGFISWVLLNGGFDVGDLGAGVTSAKDLTDIGKKTRFTSTLIKEKKVKVGDLLSSSGPSGGHIAVIAGEDDDSYYVAESLWYNPYISVALVKYSKKTIFNRYYWVMLMDDYYKEQGKVTNMWY